MATKFENLRTGDVVRVANGGRIESDHKWGVLLCDKSLDGHYSRSEARSERSDFEDTPNDSRLAKILKVTPKTVTVEITK